LGSIQKEVISWSRNISFHLNRSPAFAERQRLAFGLMTNVSGDTLFETKITIGPTREILR